MYWSVPDPAGYVFTGAAFQSIGLGFAGALGAAVVRPDRTIVVALGDGGALMGLPGLDPGPHRTLGACGDLRRRRLRHGGRSVRRPRCRPRVHALR
nr:thiamine pyrophosphate-dependent enzyme [Streptomyces spinoverrucosus]